MRTLKDDLSRMGTKVGSVRRALCDLLEDEEAMALMNLTKLKWVFSFVSVYFYAWNYLWGHRVFSLLNCFFNTNSSLIQLLSHRNSLLYPHLRSPTPWLPHLNSLTLTQVRPYTVPHTTQQGHFRHSRWNWGIDRIASSWYRWFRGKIKISIKHTTECRSLGK